MRITTLQPDEDVTKLVRRLYRSRSRKALAEAEKALLAANPHLADPAKAARGTPVIVPEVPGVDAAAGEAGDPREVVVSLLQSARAQLGDLREALTPRLQNQEREAKETLALLDTPQLRKLAEKEPEVKKRLGTIATTAQERLRRVETLRTLQQEAITQLEQDLDSFLK